jgi:CTP synthase (UTP-ammonia lyase)
MSAKTIALVGDYSEEHVAHRAIPMALELARAQGGADIAWTWVATRDIADAARDLESYSAIWLVPASPYENTEGALHAVRFARESGRPFLGTCGGFQHALLEIARNVSGIAGAAHAETEPDAAALIVTRLTCSLVEKTGWINFAPQSRIGAAYGHARASEGYHCNYGFNEAFRPALEAARVNFTAWDDAGDLRGAELSSHPFFCGVLFQPERAALNGTLSPLVVAFAKAVAARP